MDLIGGPTKRPRRRILVVYQVLSSSCAVLHVAASFADAAEWIRCNRDGVVGPFHIIAVRVA